ncbi:MAG: chemotaxis protein CheW [Arenimonas sp.]
MESQVEQLRAVLIALPGGKLMLPNTTVSEIVTYAAPEAVDGKPNWYLGAIRWKGYRLPLVSFSAMAGWDQRESVAGAKVAILKGLSGETRLPYFALLTQGFPRLVNIASDQLIDDPEHASEFYSSAYLDNDAVAIPNLEAIERLIRDNL